MGVYLVAKDLQSKGATSGEIRPVLMCEKLVASQLIALGE